MSRLRKLGHRISKAFRRISTRLTNMVMPKSQAMSFEEMMTMDDEELGKKYRKSGDWKHSKTYQKKPVQPYLDFLFSCYLLKLSF